MSLNKVMIIGNIGKDPEKRALPSGMAVTQFSVAVNGRKKGANGEWEDETEWFRVVCFDRLADRAADWLRKGKKVFVEGRLKTRKYTDKDGVERTSVEVIASNFTSLDRREGDEGGASNSAAAAPAAPADIDAVPGAEDEPF
jgi:single-strand DNA-binding protein